MNSEAVRSEGSGGVGARLARARADKGLSLADVASATRIPIRHLESIENGDFQGLPAPTYSAGFVKSYARMLDLDGQEMSDSFREEAGQGVQTPYTASYEPADPARTPPRGLALIALLAAVVIGLGYLYWRGSAEDPVTLAAASRDEPAPAPAAAPPAPAASAPAAVSAPAPVAPAAGPVVISADKDVWLKVSERGGPTLFLGVLKGGDRYEVPASAADPILTTGRPGVTRVTVGDAAIPTLGDPDRIAKDVSLKPDALRARIGAPPAVPATPAT